MRNAVIIFAGVLFGAGLAMSGMTNPAKVIGFLDFAGSWDPALAFVMGGALLTFGCGLFVMKKKGGNCCGCDLPDTSSDPISRRLLIGSAIFGIGWGLGGFCPGPAIANLALLRSEALWFVPMMLLGMFLAQRLFVLDRA